MFVLLVFALLTAAALPAAAAPTKFPWPPNCTVPSCVMLLPGPDDGSSDPAVAAFQPFTVVLRDYTGAPAHIASVVLDFSAATDLRIAAEQPPGVTADCTTATVRAWSDSRGTATIRVRGSARNSQTVGGAIPGGFGQVRVFGGYVFLKDVTAVTPDQNGAGASGTVANGIDPGDGAFLRDDLFNRPNTAGRSDLDCSGVVDPGDASVFLSLLFNDAASAAPQRTTYCP